MSLSWTRWQLIPIEPSTAMARQRDPGLPPAVLGVAESLPLADGTADAAMAILTMHHWADVDRGLAELIRVTRRRIVLLTIDVEVEATMWLFSEYVPEIAERDRREFPQIPRLVKALGAPTAVVTVPVPADCTDGFGLGISMPMRTPLDHQPGAEGGQYGQTGEGIDSQRTG